MTTNEDKRDHQLLYKETDRFMTLNGCWHSADYTSAWQDAYVVPSSLLSNENVNQHERGGFRSYHLDHFEQCGSPVAASTWVAQHGATLGVLAEMGPRLLNNDIKRKRKRVITADQRRAANIRERRRMCHLNDAFDLLRKRVPTFAYEKKLSRIETLKLAVTYISFMSNLLDSPNSACIDDDIMSNTDAEISTTANKIIYKDESV